MIRSHIKARLAGPVGPPLQSFTGRNRIEKACGFNPIAPRGGAMTPLRSLCGRLRADSRVVGLLRPPAQPAAIQKRPRPGFVPGPLPVTPSPPAVGGRPILAPKALVMHNADCRHWRRGCGGVRTRGAVPMPGATSRQAIRRLIYSSSGPAARRSGFLHSTLSVATHSSINSCHSSKSDSSPSKRISRSHCSSSFVAIIGFFML